MPQCFTTGQEVKLYPVMVLLSFERDVCRDVITEYGYGEYFVHRTGHSIGQNVHGWGANLDNLETRDERRLIPETGFSIEPGLYFPGEFAAKQRLPFVPVRRQYSIRFPRHG